MSNRLALVLLAAVVVSLVADAALNGGAATLFLLRKLAGLVEYLSFWR